MGGHLKKCINDRKNEKNQKEKCMDDRKNEKNKYIADLTTLNHETLRASQAFAACVKKNEELKEEINELKEEINELNNELNNENKDIKYEGISSSNEKEPGKTTTPPIECEQGFVWNPMSGCRLDRKVEDGGGGKKKKKTKRRSTR